MIQVKHSSNEIFFQQIIISEKHDSANVYFPTIYAL